MRDPLSRSNNATSAAGPSSSRTSLSMNPVQNTTYNPAAAFGVAVSEWTDADNALAALPSLQADVDHLKRRLAEEQTTYQALKDQNAVIFSNNSTSSKTTSKLSMLARLSITGRKSSNPSPTSPTSANARNRISNASLESDRDFHSSYGAEVQAQKVMEATAAQLTSVRSERDRAKALAESSDELFGKLWHVAKITFPPNYVASSGVLTDATRTLQEEEEAATEASQLHTDFQRACQSAQKAHELHRLVMDLCDSARDQQRSANGSFGALSQIGVRNEFAAALKESVGARVCLKECLRLLAIHASLVPSFIATYVNKLHTLGVAQIVDMHDLLFGLRRGEANRETTLALLEEHQKEAFKHLTEVAIWLQDRVPELAAAEVQVKERRRQARQGIVSVWEAALHGHRSQQSNSTPSSSPSMPRRMSISQSFDQRTGAPLSVPQRPPPSAFPGDASIRTISSTDFSIGGSSRTTFDGSPLFSQYEHGSPATTIGEDPNCSPRTIRSVDMQASSPNFVSIAAGSSSRTRLVRDLPDSQATPMPGMSRRESTRTIPMPSSPSFTPLLLPGSILEQGSGRDRSDSDPQYLDAVPEYDLLPAAAADTDLSLLGLSLQRGPTPSPAYEALASGPSSIPDARRQGVTPADLLAPGLPAHRTAALSVQAGQRRPSGARRPLPQLPPETDILCFNGREPVKTDDRVRQGQGFKMPVPTAGRSKTRSAPCQPPTPMNAPGLTATLATTSLSIVQLSVQTIRSCFGIPVRPVASSRERTGLLWAEEDRYGEVDTRWSMVPGFNQDGEDEAGDTGGNQNSGVGGNVVRPVSSRRSSMQPPTYGTAAPR